MDMFWWMIIGVVILAATALGTALYAWKLHKNFPKVVKAKVMREEKIEEINPVDRTKTIRYRYYFKGRDNGNKMLTDSITYKEKKFKSGEKVSVHMAEKGSVCHSDVPLWPAATSAICILLALVLPLAYVSNERAEQAQIEANTILQDTGTYVVTDKGVLFDGANTGLVVVDGITEYISTGDYGYIFYQGEPHYEGEGSLMCVHALSLSVSQDGSVKDLDTALVDEITELGYIIDETESIYGDLVAAAEGDASMEEIADDHEGHDHEGHDHAAAETVTDEVHDVVVESTETSDTISEETVTAATEEVVETTTEPAN